MKYLSLIAMAFLVSACALPKQGQGTSEYKFVGFENKVCQNPGTDGSQAFGPFGIPTDYVVFKQVGFDGTIGEITTNCK